jgi:xylulose-5-phosphate/fructose-6-phosphate phosphoketolase
MTIETDLRHTPLSALQLESIDAWWRAANYLSVGQIYLLDNPLLREPLRPEHVKPRLLGHWGTTPGLNFIYAHMNRAIRARGLSTIFVTGPGHGGPGLVAGAYLDGTYSEVYPHIARDEEGLRRLCRQSLVPPAGSRATSRPRRPGRSMRAARSGTRCCTRLEPCSTTRTCSRFV